jgi:hypothetical protein
LATPLSETKKCQDCENTANPNDSPERKKKKEKRKKICDFEMCEI